MDMAPHISLPTVGPAFACELLHPPPQAPAVCGVAGRGPVRPAGAPITLNTAPCSAITSLSVVCLSASYAVPLLPRCGAVLIYVAYLCNLGCRM